jgi:hypothetical protein
LTEFRQVDTKFRRLFACLRDKRFIVAADISFDISPILPQGIKILIEHVSAIVDIEEQSSRLCLIEKRFPEISNGAFAKSIYLGYEVAKRK